MNVLGGTAVLLLAVACTSVAASARKPSAEQDCGVERVADEYDRALERLALRVGYSGPPMCRARLGSGDHAAGGESPFAHCRQQWSMLLRVRSDPTEMRRTDIEYRLQNYVRAGTHNELTRTILLGRARGDLRVLDGETRARRERVETLILAETDQGISSQCASVVEQTWRKLEELRQELAGIAGSERAIERVLVNEIVAMKTNIEVMRELRPNVVARQKADIAEREEELRQYRTYLANRRPDGNGGT